MKITEFSVKNYQFTLVVFIAVLALGAFSLLNMPKGEDPEPTFPGFTVVVVYPGASPTDLEEQVVDPMEKRFNELEDIDQLITEVGDGIAVTRVEFEWGVDVDEKYQEVVREVGSLQRDLPADIARIDVNKISPTDVNIFQIAIVSETASYRQLEAEAEELKTELEKIRSLKNVDSWGFPEQQVQIELNLEKMAQLRIPTNAVMNVLQSENLNIPGGNVNVNAKKFNVKTSGNYKSLNEIENTVVFSGNGQVVYLKDIGSVRMDYENENHLTRLNGHRAIFVTASQKESQNIFAVRSSVLPVLEKFEKQLPKNMDYYKVFDQSASVGNRMGRFAKDFAIAICLVLITLLPLGTRASLVVMISIPLSIAIGLTILNFFGYTLNQLSIVGLIVALGILVDDSIVVVENIERYMRMGFTRRKAAVEATKQISIAVLGCTATLILAFLPLLYLPGNAGDFIRSLPMAVVSTVVASLAVSLTVVPFLSSVLLKNHTNPEGNFIFRAFKGAIDRSYAPILKQALRFPILTLLVAALIFVGSMMLIPSVGFSLFPASDRPMFMINVETPQGTNLYETNRIMQEVEEKLAKEKLIKYYASNVGRGNPRVYYNVISFDQSENIGQIFIQLHEVELEEKEVFIDKLRKEFKEYAGAKIRVENFEQGPPIEAPIAIRVLGENLDTLQSVAAQIEELIANTAGTIYVTNPLKTKKTELAVNINKEKASALGIPIAEIDRTVRMGVAGLGIGNYRDEAGDEYEIIVTIPKATKIPNLEVFDKMYVNSMAGAAVPLRQVADVQFKTSTSTIRHYDKGRYVTVTALVQTGFLTSEINAELTEKLANFKFPEGFTYKVAGEVESQEKSFAGIGLIILVTVFGLLAVLILEFKTFKSTLIVLSVIPLGIIGAILILLIFGQTLSFTATIGIIALAGIEVKNSILLVDFTNQLREDGASLEEAIQKAGEIRFVPILLTSLTAIGGLIPLVIEYSPLYSPLALVLIGGLISSTLLSRLVTPVMYKLLPPRIEKDTDLV